METDTAAAGAHAGVDDVRICLGMIVRNESRVLPRLVASLDGVIDQWLIVDTGSDDGTPEVARELLGHLPGQVVSRPWVNFGHNRTELVEMCRVVDEATHLLLVDADQVVETTPDFRQVLGRSPNDQHLVMVRSGNHGFRMPYLVRRGPRWVYRGPTHEYLDCLDPVTTAPFDDLVVIHHSDGGTRPEKYDRDLGLLLDHLADHPDDARNTFYLAQTYWFMGRHADALAAYRRRVDLGGFDEERYYSLLRIGDLHVIAGDIAEALWAWQQAVGVRPGRAEAYHRLGRTLNHQRQWWAARVWLEHAASLPPSDDILFVEHWVENWGVAFELALANWWTGERQAADAVFADLAERPDVDEPHREACRTNLALSGQ